jgi:uncharacterized protein YqcC (DUF446 family)
MSGQAKHLDTSQVRAKLDEVITELKRKGLWDISRPSDDKFENMGPFGMNTMPFSDWLRWVFVPRVESLIETDGPWPTGSSVATQAMREGDTDPDIKELVPVLSRFDELFPSH